MLLHTPGACFFHSSPWARVLAESYGYIPLYFSVQENGTFKALVPVMEVKSILTGKRGVSLPFTDYCEPIISEGVDFIYLFNRIIEYGKTRGWKYIELRGASSFFAPCPSNLEPPTLSPAPSPVGPASYSPAPRALHPAPVFRSYLGHTLDLTRGEERIFSALRDSTRRNIRKAEKEKVEVRMGSTPGAVSEFYRLNCLTRREHGLPPQPYHFFVRIQREVFSKENGFVALAYFNGKAVAGNVFFHFGRQAIYKYGASDKSYQSLRANNLVMWEAIKYFCQRGARSFCFGRTELGNDGLRTFKRGWGTEETAINYYKYSLKEGCFVNSRGNDFPNLPNMILNKMPIPALKIIGDLAYKHMG